MQQITASNIKKDTTYATSGWFIGINFGSYFANKYTANFYNGSGINNLQTAIIDNSLNKQSIINNFNGKNFGYDSTSLSQNMKYDAAICIGFHLRKLYKNQTSIFFETNYSKLKTSDVVILQIYDPSVQISEPVTKEAPITGQEERIDLSIGIQKTITLKKVSPFMAIGININNVRYIKSLIQIDALQFSLQNPSYSYYNMKQGGIGFGVFSNLGIEAKFNKDVIMSLGANLSYKKINMEDKSKYLFNKMFYVQLILNMLSFFGNTSK